MTIIQAYACHQCVEMICICKCSIQSGYSACIRVSGLDMGTYSLKVQFAQWHFVRSVSTWTAWQSNRWPSSYRCPAFTCAAHVHVYTCTYMCYYSCNGEDARHQPDGICMCRLQHMQVNVLSWPSDSQLWSLYACASTVPSVCTICMYCTICSTVPSVCNICSWQMAQSKIPGELLSLADMQACEMRWGLTFVSAHCFANASTHAAQRIWM